MAHITVRNLSFRYPEDREDTLKNLNLQIEQGDYVVLCGRSGSGKSTLLRHLKTQLTPYGRRTGEILLDGVALEQIDSRTQAAAVGFVMQDPDDQIVTDRVWHELVFGLENLGCDPQVMQVRVAEMASYFGIQDWFDRDVGKLSGGQKQLLNLASIMAMQPQVLVLDEPTSQLDPIAAADFLATVRKINVELGTTVIITEHRLEEIYACADQVLVLEQGRLAACGGPREVGAQLWASKNPMFAALPAPVRAFYQVSGEGECPLTVREGRRWLTGAMEQCTLRRTEPEESEPALSGSMALRVREGWFRYERRGKDVLQGLELAVPAGSICAILGGNGTGKSTALKVCCGSCRLYRGRVEVFGKSLAKYKPGELFRGCLAMLPQDPKCLFSGKTLREDLEEMTRDPEAISRAAELCEVTNLLDAHPRDLSGGEQQRAALAKVLLTGPRLLLLDEPTKGLDSFYQRRFAQILQQLSADGVTVVLVSHDVEFCAQYAQLVSMFFNGRIVTTEPPRRFFGQTSFYTTAANRMSRCIFRNAVTVEDVAALYRENRGPSA